MSLRGNVHRRDEAAGRMVAFRNNSQRQKFPLGQIVATPAALDALAKSGDSAHGIFCSPCDRRLGRPLRADKQANDAASRKRRAHLFRVSPADGTKVWVITENDRSATTLLLPSDY